MFSDLYSNKYIKKSIDEGLVQVDNQPAVSGQWVVEGQVISWVVPEVQIIPVLEQHIEVVYDDPNLAVVIKPAGIEVSGNKSHTLERALPFNLELPDTADALTRPQPVHRLDFHTRGLLVVAKTRNARKRLGLDFADARIKKQYQALVKGRVDADGVITQDGYH
jgi:23S rRNA-/tRNA-specific pseudouridylate synthase